MQMKHLLLLASLLTCMGAGAQQATFRNPVIAGDMADPTVIRVDNTYYATGTSSEWAPYYPLFRSKDLVNWRQIGHLFEQQPAWTRSSFWAPELFHRNGKTYAYYTARRKTDGTSYIGVATADAGFSSGRPPRRSRSQGRSSRLWSRRCNSNRRFSASAALPCPAVCRRAAA